MRVGLIYCVHGHDLRHRMNTRPHSKFTPPELQLNQLISIPFRIEGSTLTVVMHSIHAA